MAKKPRAPSLKPPEGYRTREARWGTEYMTPSEKMQFGNMVAGHNMAQPKKGKKATPVPKGRVGDKNKKDK